MGITKCNGYFRSCFKSLALRKLYEFTTQRNLSKNLKSVPWEPGTEREERERESGGREGERSESSYCISMLEMRGVAALIDCGALTAGASNSKIAHELLELLQGNLVLS